MNWLELAIGWSMMVTAIVAFFYGATGCSRAPLRPDPAAMVARTHERLKHGSGACKRPNGQPVEGCR